jgi:hypothetical protein
MLVSDNRAVAFLVSEPFMAWSSSIRSIRLRRLVVGGAHASKPGKVEPWSA